MSETLTCQSCSMTIESGTYCQYCTDDNGGLLSFPETFERFVQFAIGQDPGLARADAEKKTLAFMSEQPAWRDNPELAKRKG